ncbi:MAG: NAD-binding protein [Myxococcales bacterium]|nr:NAD-binding protein [Myxococcales bacterium]MCB9525618.1 NAD-binding protein [Myxococcales bacterium]
MRRLLHALWLRLQHSYGTQLFRLAVLIAAILFFSSSGLLYFEMHGRPDLSWGDAVWWSVVTMTTVGYGDLFPETVAGRYLIGFPTMLFGISILGYVLSITASVLIEVRTKELRGMSDVTFEDHFLLVHWPGLGRAQAVVGELRGDPKTARTPIVLIDDRLEELPESLARLGVSFVRGNPTKLDTLERAHYQKAKQALVLARDQLDPASDHATLAAVLTIEQLRPEINTTGECVDPDNLELFARAGCDDMVCIAQLSSNLLVQEALDPGVQGLLQEITSNTYGQRVFVVPIRAMGTWRYQELLDAFSGADVLCIGLRHEDGMELNPAPGARVRQGDRLVCIARQRPAEYAPAAS